MMEHERRQHERRRGLSRKKTCEEWVDDIRTACCWLHSLYGFGLMPVCGYGIGGSNCGAINIAKLDSENSPHGA